MNKSLGHTPLAEVLAPSIRDDVTIRAAAKIVDNALKPMVQAIPRMLFWARLWQDEKGLSPSLRRIVHFCGGLPPLSDEELELLAWQMHVDFWDQPGPGMCGITWSSILPHGTASRVRQHLSQQL